MVWQQTVGSWRPTEKELERLRIFWSVYGLSADDLSKLYGVHKKTMWMWLRGERDPSRMDGPKVPGSSKLVIWEEFPVVSVEESHG